MKGILYPSIFSPECFKEALEYQARPDDNFIVTYPKCGTTWMQNVCLYIFRKGKELDDPSQALLNCPFLDMFGQEGVDIMHRPGAIKTHLPYNLMPYHPDAKYIFVTRNPKDCCVSLYHHARMIPGFAYWDGVFDEFYELFLEGEVEFGDYFDHLLSWYPHRNDKNVFYTTYEQMKRNIEDVVVNLARFLGKEFIDEIERDNSVLKNIVKFSGFDYMKKNMTLFQYLNADLKGLRYVKSFTASLDLPKVLPKEEFVRKGIVGDYKSYFSEDQLERMNKKFMEKLKDTEVLNWFKE